MVGQSTKQSYFNLLIYKAFIYFAIMVYFALHYRYNTRLKSVKNHPIKLIKVTL